MIESARHAAVARNLDALLTVHALGRSELADRLGLPVKWVRAVVSTGVSRTERRNAYYLRSVAESGAALVRESVARLAPAGIVYGQGYCSLAAHRDFFDEERKQFVCGFNPGAPADDTVLVARVTREDGELLATVVNYACHPTTSRIAPT